MTTRAQQLIAAITHPPEIERADLGRLVMWAGLLASALPCGLLLMIALWSGEFIPNPGVYGALVALYIALLLLIDLQSRATAWFWRHLWAFLLVLSLVCLAIQAQTAESFLQPIIFLIPLIYAAFAYSWRRVAPFGVWLIGLMNVGIWLGGQHAPVAFLFPTFGYGTFMIFTYAFVQLSLQQAAARREADRLAADLALQRDYLSRLVEITATLTRDLDLAAVLEQVAAAGRSLAHAATARLAARRARWRRRGDSAGGRGAARHTRRAPRYRDAGRPSRPGRGCVAARLQALDDRRPGAWWRSRCADCPRRRGPAAAVCRRRGRRDRERPAVRASSHVGHAGRAQPPGPRAA